MSLKIKFMKPLVERVNNIFLKIDKKFIIFIGFFFLLSAVSAGLLKMTLNIMYPGKQLALVIKESIKDTFGKAVKFDSYYFRLNGDIVLLNFYLSNTTDFNDNFNLVKCYKIVIDTDILRVLNNDIAINGVYIYEPELNIVKNYGKNYYDVIEANFTSGINKELFEKLAGNGFFINIYDGKGNYREVFHNGKNTIQFNDFNLKIKYRDKKIRYKASGDIIRRDKSLFDTCSFTLKGLLDTLTMKSESRFRINNFDIIQLEEYLSDKNLTEYKITGDLSADIRISHADNFTRFNGDCSVDDLECFTQSENCVRYLCKKDDISSEFNLYFSDDLSFISVEKALVEDGIFRISGNLEYHDDNNFSLDFSSNKINLKKLSDYWIFFNGCEYDGYLDLKAKMIYSFDQKRPEQISIGLGLDRFNLRKTAETDPGKMIVKNCNTGLSLNKEGINFTSAFSTAISDFKISAETSIANWSPFTSSTKLSSSSDKLELRLIKNGFVSFVKFIYDEAYVDMFQNFDEQRNFLKEPEGIFINNNDVEINVTADSVPVTGKSSFSDFNINLSLVKGTLTTKNFSLNGFSGLFAFNIYAAFRQDYPFIKITGSLSGLDLGALSASSEAAYGFSGILGGECKFETSAYRIGQVIENGNASLSLSLSAGSFENFRFLKNIHENITANGVACDNFDSIIFNSASFDFAQVGGEFYIRKFNISGSGVNLNGYGKYFGEGGGLKLPLSLQVKNGTEYARVPLLMSGELLAPCIKVDLRNSKGEVCL
jgi:hypothetical protein